MPDYKLISADSHVSEPPDLWSSRVDRQYRDRAPRLVVNPPGKIKYQYWTSERKLGRELDKWMASAKEHAGSWWPDWIEWIKDHESRMVPARKVGSSKYKPIEDAPGSYVKVKS